MTAQIDELLKGFAKASTGASPDSIANVAAALRTRFPSDYVTFMQ